MRITITHCGHRALIELEGFTYELNFPGDLRDPECASDLRELAEAIQSLVQTFGPKIAAIMLADGRLS